MSDRRGELPLRVGVNFVRHFYAALVERPESLEGFYALAGPIPRSAAEGTIAAVFPDRAPRAGAVEGVRVDALRAASIADGALRVDVSGVLFRPPGAAGARERGFTQTLELRELRPAAFAIAHDAFAFAGEEGGPHGAWAADTPPMFARPADADADADAARAIARAGLRQPDATAKTDPSPFSSSSSSSFSSSSSSSLSAPSSSSVSPSSTPTPTPAAVEAARSFAARVREGGATAPAKPPLRVAVGGEKAKSTKAPAKARKGGPKAKKPAPKPSSSSS